MDIDSPVAAVQDISPLVLPAASAATPLTAGIASISSAKAAQMTTLPQDFGVALVDDFAVMGDTLTHYQDAVAQEAALSTSAGADIESVSFLVMEQQARAAQQDLKGIMNGVKHSTLPAAALTLDDRWSDWKNLFAMA